MVMHTKKFLIQSEDCLYCSYTVNIFIRPLDKKFWLNEKKILINNHYKIIYEQVRIYWSSCGVLLVLGMVGE